MYTQLFDTIRKSNDQEGIEDLISKMKMLKKSDLYEIAYRTLQGELIHDLIEDIENNNIGLEGFPFRKQRRAQKEEDDFIANPAEVVEGVLECNNCGSKRTVSFSLQTQSGDEGTAVWARCVECKATWRA